MANHSIDERIKQIAADAAVQNSVEFVHAEIVGTKRNLTVRVYIDKPEGVTIEDCSIVSKRIEAVLDADDFIPSAYLLEVSSPGLERELYSVGDFEKFIGQRAKVKVRNAIKGQKVFIGRIAGIENAEIVFDDKTNGTVRFPYEEVAKANLRVDLEKEFKKRVP
ncbi:MAG: ribosome maturation factor RimP [Pyrinomonadaceae bacterium]|nr:ribosome maturation factor RimP [Blastocatellia bacterium]MDQ3221591.1 ribosome maturation factor RimP [Acidobacteriota bacterium]MDQ3491416.1 ribosome maturation factor RimP [Acidobacteriota bacterium]